LQHHLRDGKKYILKSEKDLDFSIDHSERCDRHDRHLQMPGYRELSISPQ
jgi:hypothetical protein